MTSIERQGNQGATLSTISWTLSASVGTKGHGDGTNAASTGRLLNPESNKLPEPLLLSGKATRSGPAHPSLRRSVTATRPGAWPTAVESPRGPGELSHRDGPCAPPQPFARVASGCLCGRCKGGRGVTFFKCYRNIKTSRCHSLVGGDIPSLFAQCLLARIGGCPISLPCNAHKMAATGWPVCTIVESQRLGQSDC